MKFALRWLGVLCLSLVLGSPALAQRIQPGSGPTALIGCAYSSSPPTLTSGWFGYVQCDNAGKLQVNAAVTASISGFAPAATGTPISVTTGGVTGTLPAGAVVVAFNTGATNTAYCKLGASATTSDIAIPPASWFAYTVGASTQLTCITSTSTTTVNMVGGAGLPTGAGGGGGGAGSGGAVYGPTAVGSAAANPPVLFAGTANATATGNVQVAKVDSSGTVYMDCVAGGTLCTALATGVGTPGSAPPANVIYMGVNGSGATGGQMKGVTGCDATVVYDASTNGSTELVALTSGRSVYVCGYTILSGGTVNVKLITGTGTACATGTASITPAFQLTAQVGAVDGSPFWRGLKGASASALCINSSAGVAVQAIVYYSVI